MGRRGWSLKRQFGTRWGFTSQMTEVQAAHHVWAYAPQSFSLPHHLPEPLTAIEKGIIL